MSFHLRLEPRTGPLDLPAFEAMFARRNYEVADGQAAYQNPDTGVYFLFELADGGVDFAINTRRSEIFAIEAGVELEALFAGFDIDGQPFSEAAFLEQWREANLAAVATMLAEGATPLARMRKSNVAMWRWNYGLQRLQHELEDEAVAAPLTFFAAPDGSPRPTFIWLMTMPMVLPPPAEAVLLADEPALRLRDRLLGTTPPPHDTIGVMAIRWLRDLRFHAWTTNRAPGLTKFHVPREGRTPVDLASLAAAEGYAKPAGAAIPIDQVLDRETVEAARALA